MSALPERDGVQVSLDAALRSLLAPVVRDAVQAAMADLNRQEAPLPALLTREQLAQQLGVSVGTLNKLRRAGLPHVTVGELPRFELGSVLDWLRERQARAEVGSSVIDFAVRAAKRKAGR